MSISNNLALVRERIKEAAKKTGKNPEDITLLGVSKKHLAEKIIEAYKAGLKDIGENYVQEALGKMEFIQQKGITDINWHFIGRLQRNKAKYVVGKFVLIHGVDSEKLILELEKQSAKRCEGRKQPFLIEVNVGGEETKGGVEPEDVDKIVEVALEQPHLELQGFMTIPPPYTGEKIRPYFKKMREIKEEIEKKFKIKLPHLSMGMSADFEVAIEEGATIVRIGTAIFGPRPT